MPVVWLNGVTADDSVSWLTALAMSVSDLGDGERHRRVAKPAIAAIALHDAPAADRALESFVTATRPDWVRGDTTFWLGSARGDNGLRVLTRVIAEDPSEKVREKAVFGLSVSKSPAALPALIATASDHTSARVRSRALFWLGQSKDARAVQFFAEILAAK